MVRIIQASRHWFRQFEKAEKRFLNGIDWVLRRLCETEEIGPSTETSCDCDSQQNWGNTHSLVETSRMPKMQKDLTGEMPVIATN